MNVSPPFPSVGGLLIVEMTRSGVPIVIVFVEVLQLLFSLVSAICDAGPLDAAA